MATDLLKDVQNMRISDNHTQTSQTEANGNHTLKRNVDLSDGFPNKHAELSNESQNHSEHTATRNMSVSKWSTYRDTNADPQDHFVKRKDGGFKLNDGNGANNGNDEDPLVAGQDPNIHIPRKPLPSDSDIVTDHTKTNTPVDYPLPKTNTVFQTLKESRLPLAGTAGRELGYSEDVSLQTKQDEAVTHETIQPVIHNVRHEKITREFVDTHIVHRIQPIDQIEYLPARHFILLPNGQRKEVLEEDVMKELGLT